jgi:hypothetical protein
MKKDHFKILSAIIFSVILLAAFPVTALAASPSDVVIGNNYTLESGRTLNSDLVVLGGTVDLKDGSVINGNVFLLGGTARAAGTINGNVTVLGGTINLAGTFLLNGDLNTAGGTVNREQGARITGQENINTGDSTIVIPGGIQIPAFSINANPVFNILWFFIELFIWVLVAMIVAMFLPDHLGRTFQTALSQPILSGGLGLLTAIILPIILVLLVITICLIPVSLLGGFLLVVAWAFGMISLGFELGKRITLSFKQEWHPAFSAGLGMLVLMLVLNGLQAIVPCVGWIPKALVSIWMLGSVLLTQFGTKPYPHIPVSPGIVPQEPLPPSS